MHIIIVHRNNVWIVPTYIITIKKKLVGKIFKSIL